MSPNIFEAFNARALSAEEVAKSFVPPPHFSKLIQRSNALMVGPRGSGKTTLLKMLQQSALESWSDEEADEYVSKIDYTSVFIPTDRRWSLQLASLGGGRLADTIITQLSVAAFTTHVLRSIASAMHTKIHPLSGDVVREFRRVNIDYKDELNIVRIISGAWKVSPPIPTLLSVKQSLTQRLLDLRTLANMLVLIQEDQRDSELLKHDYLFLSFLEAATLAVEAFNDSAGIPEERWALAFDELELAPEAVHHELIAALRAADQRLLLKLALSPAHQQGEDLEAAFQAAPTQDFEPIRLWYVERVEGREFCRRLWYAMLRARGLPERDPKLLLGRSFFDEEAQGAQRGKYKRGDPWIVMFERMSQNDSSFREYLIEHNIELGDVQEYPEHVRASRIRKIAPLLPLREFYRSSGAPGSSQRQTLRGRKVPTLYAGSESLFAITEGNPRWFKAIVSSLLDRFPGGKRPIPKSTQARELQKASERFTALLRTTPVSVTSAFYAKKGVLGLIKEIAEYFHDQHVEDKFQPEPPSSFTVHSHAPEELNALLEAALNAGAIVYIPSEEGQMLLSSLRGKTFRLSYLLAPVYGLPVRLGRSVSLGSILSASERDPSSKARSLFEGPHDD